ncbi:MAG: hypothetical protein D3M94_15380 [Rhodocyclales bacterium GT-UBC]|nr:MAG: hypothetical protein D3M94_15380 [Rhodocyclales bacterium GT-UBC]
MHWLKLPAAQSKQTPAFLDTASAKQWLAIQPLTQPLAMLALLTEQIEALDASDLPLVARLELLDFLRRAAMPALLNLEARFTRRALPMLGEDRRIFESSQRLWSLLGIAYLRLAQQFAADKMAVALHRAANALRQAEYCHYQASRECPQLLDQLLFGVLALAGSNKLLEQAMHDPDYAHLGEANIGGLIAWAFLLRVSDPYALNGQQLAVTNRALSRWRELSTFQTEPEEDPKALAVDLAKLFGASLPEGIPRWLNVRPIARKIRSRIASLKAGESPEALKLGRELSPTACIRLLGEIDRKLRPSPPMAAATDAESIELAFGGEAAYAVFTGESLNPGAAMTMQSTAMSHERLRVFGFDNVAQVATSVQRVDVPTETWLISDGQPWRPGHDGPRLQAPCLVSTLHGAQPRLGVLSRLLCDISDQLSGRLNWYSERIEACTLKRPAPQPRIAVFLLYDDRRLTLIAPIHAGIRLDIGIELDGTANAHLVPFEVIERGVDFVRYICRRT